MRNAHTDTHTSTLYTWGNVLAYDVDMGQCASMMYIWGNVQAYDVDTLL